MLCSSGKWLHYLNILGPFALLGLMAMLLPQSLIGAFNPVVMNLAMISLSLVLLMLQALSRPPAEADKSG